jgi:hydroxyacid-oxoacid transhydrogenase
MVDHPIVPHGIAVAITGPAVFAYTAPSSPDRHREAARIFNEYMPDGINENDISDEGIGGLLHDRIARFLVGLDVPRGASALGYKVTFIWTLLRRDTDEWGIQNSDINELVAGTLPQVRSPPLPIPLYTDEIELSRPESSTSLVRLPFSLSLSLPAPY